MSDIYDSIGNAFVGTATPYYAEQGHFYLESNNVKDGQINHNSEIFINDEFYEKQKDKWLHTGDMVMVQSGHVGHAAVIPEELDNTAAHALIMFRNPKEEIEPYFLNYEYQTDKAKKKIENITTGNTIKHILASDMQEFVVDVPNYEEQKVIASYFRNIDHLITLHQRKCDEVKSLKKYMLQKMFPQNEQKVPEIRFEGFTEAWEQRKVLDLLKLLTDYDANGSFADMAKNVNTMDGSGYAWYVRITDLENPKPLSELKYVDKLSYEFLKKTELHGGELLMAKRGDIGKVYIFEPRTKYATVAPNMYLLKLNNKVIPHFLYDYFVSDEGNKKLARLNASSTMGALYKDDVKNIDVIMPSIEEQSKIGIYFQSLDHLITLHQQKCEELKKIKKFMLQKMFV